MEPQRQEGTKRHKVFVLLRGFVSWWFKKLNRKIKVQVSDTTMLNKVDVADNIKILNIK